MQVGNFFNDKYFVEKILGRGGMGIVYLARNINTDKFWAIKEIIENPDTEIEASSEPNLLKKLDHPAFPRLYDIIEQRGRLYMITDYIDGVSLDKKLEMEGRFSEPVVADWAMQLCRALDYLHTIKPNPIIYRDIKPSNIMLTDKGMLKLIDFGTAREYKAKSDTDTVYIGTRGYAAPEQFGSGQTSAASDIYSLGVTLHHLVTGKSPNELPYSIEPIRYYDQTLSSGLKAIITKCTCESAAGRYQSAAELLHDLACMYGGQGFTGAAGRKSTGAMGTRFTGLLNVGGTDNGKASGHDNEKVKFTQAPDPACRQSNELPDASGRNGNKDKARDTGRADIAEKPELKPQARSFKRLVITVWDNAEFGCELAYTAAGYTGGEVLLADLDLLSPKADLILDIGKYPLRLTKSGMLGHSGLDIAADAAAKGALTSALLKQAAVVRNNMNNLYIITGNYRLENYEYYSEDTVPRLIDTCYRSFDITVLLVNRSIYDAFTLAALLRSDVNIAAVKGEIGLIREFNTYIAFLNEKQQLPLENTWFVLFEHDKASDMNEAEVRQATQNNLLGCVSGSRKRILYRNFKSAYVTHMEKEILAEYYRIHQKLGLVPQEGLLPKLRKLYGSMPADMGHDRVKALEG